MTPFEFVDQYHKFTVNDARMGLSFQTEIKGYNNQVSKDGQTEIGNILYGLSRKYFNGGLVPRVFNIRNEPRISPSESYSIGALRRALLSRGSPYEFKAAVRLAYLADRIGPTRPYKSAADYCNKFFTNDCVSFAGNYTGVSPATSVFAYALGYTEKELKQPNFPDFRISAPRVHIPPCKKMEDVKQGDLLLTFAKPDHRGLNWRHIAVVEYFHKVSPTEAVVSFAEWGWDIAKDHKKANRSITVHDGSKGKPDVWRMLKAVMPRFKDFNPAADKIVCFDGEAPVDRSPALRIFFDASSLMNLETRGWLVAGKPAPD